jgi:HK97 family phage portal protein
VKFLGLEITRTKSLPPTNLTGVDNRGGWWPLIREGFAGAWQTNTDVTLANVVTYSPVYACIRLISSDIGKLNLQLVEKDGDGIWDEIENPAFSPVLRKPNRYQGRIKFVQQWLVSKLTFGNAYILKERDNRGVVVALYVLDPIRVRPVVAPDGAVYYQLSPDNLTGLQEAATVPASEIIHDVHVPLYHPLVGVSPITACGVAAVEAIRIQDSSATFFGNGSKPGGILTAPGNISQDTANRVKDFWDTNFTGTNSGKVAVLGDGMQYTQMSVNAHDAQLIEQLNWTALDVCVAFGVPPYKINVGPPPNYNNIQALDIQYYSQCLQEFMESFEEALDFGLGLAPDKVGGVRLGTYLCREDLLQMDTAGRMEAAAKAIYSGLSPNEVRKRYHDVGPVNGGDAVYMQQQNFSIEALAKRDAMDDPFARATAKIDANAVGAQEDPADAAAAAAAPTPAPTKAVTADLDESVLKTLSTGFYRERVTA